MVVWNLLTTAVLEHCSLLLALSLFRQAARVEVFLSVNVEWASLI